MIDCEAKPTLAHRLWPTVLIFLGVGTLLGSASVQDKAESVALEPTARLGEGPARENSGIVRSRRDPNHFWMQNDSGDAPRIYPVRRDGSVVPSRIAPETPGVLIVGAFNIDWEDIALDSAGRIIIADFGNNLNSRPFLTLYYVDEPKPDAAQATPSRIVRYRYPDQTAFPAPRDDFNYDAEALFTLGERVYVLTKHRSDTKTKLYRLDDDGENPEAIRTLTLLDTFDIQGQVTAADASADRRRVAIATYQTIWLFENDAPTEDIFGGRIRRFDYESQQVEALCFLDDETLLLADEALAVLYEVKIDQFRTVD